MSLFKVSGLERLDPGGIGHAEEAFFEADIPGTPLRGKRGVLFYPGFSRAFPGFPRNPPSEELNGLGNVFFHWIPFFFFG